jgi:hypothetical protein
MPGHHGSDPAVWPAYDKEAGRPLDATQKGDVAVVDKSEVRQARKSLFGLLGAEDPLLLR